MKLTRFTPSNGTSLGRGTDFNQWLRNPFADYPSMASLLDLGGFLGPQAAPQLAIDVYEDADNFYARFEVPGVKKEDVKVELANGLLSVSVEKREKTASGEKTQSVSRSIRVPESVSADKVAAKLEDGVLTLTLPKQEDRKPRSITVS